ncbi:MAG: fumarylacetoacetate hydrolase family protein [Actinobacteria bacterium]|nr:fumarylacetoacetate hydrolase family protein [Actinomycetota bacterium]HQY13517.1 fumarylacetoacetate hydrolase family protein [Ilumatobacteraceae bacterium]HRA82796.1 fumarylacetoacetate hydrolase family protein [Ilumatobacteraceae bacterium]
MFRLAHINGRAALLDATHWFDLAGVTGDQSLADPMVAIARHAELHIAHDALASATPGGAIAEARLGACVPRPEKVFAIGLNYRSHAEESGMAIPPAPMTFTKFPTCLVGPTDDIVLSGAFVDWEVELVAVIGTGGRHISRDAAWSHVAGLTLGQDISDRVVQMTGAPAQFSMGKSFDTFGPIGPAVVSLDAFPDPDNVRLWCDVAGERMQDARTDDLIFSVPEIIEYLSAICTLTAGDIIFTGTPSGVGGSRGRFLAEGETIDSGAEIIGSLHNRCVAP